MSAKLPSDQYYIRNGDTFAGRNAVEDRSLLPKKVFCPPDRPLELWVLVQLPNGRYQLRARGAPTGEINNLLYAYLIDDEKAEEWVITYREHIGNRPQYTIEKADRSAGWVRQIDVEDPQIAVRPLIVQPTDPPQYEKAALWNIQPLVD